MKTKHFNSVFAIHFIQYLVDLGVTNFCIAPGSRSTPLAVAIARHPKTDETIFFDERSAAFFALGLSKSTLNVTVLLTTSGTAVANAFPAIIEANQSNIPLLIISADRPPELRKNGANQSIDQIKLFSDQVRFFFDFPCPSNEFNPKKLASTLSHSIAIAKNSSGPVHLNCPFREPLEPISVPKQQFARVYETVTIDKVSVKATSKLKTLIENSKRGVLVLGEITSQENQRIAFQIAKTLNWPVFADISSGCRLKNISNQLFPVDTILKSDHLIDPDLVIQIGRGLTPKIYEQWISSLQCEHIIVNPYTQRQDPSHSCTIHFPISFRSFLEIIDSTDTNPNLLLQYTTKLQESISILLAQSNNQNITEIELAKILPLLIPKNGQLFLSNSMPIRDVNRFAPDKYNVATAANRGASGIDGILSTAAGVAYGNNKPTLLLIGDLAAMHDIGSWLTIRNLNIDLVVVIVNNGGGGIFSLLPISNEKDIFEQYFATSHQNKLLPIIQEMGISSYQPTTIPMLKECVLKAFEHGGIHCIEVYTNRDQNKQLHITISEQIQDLIHEIKK
jgi:2-succinyl-5-enolpyruvyl-6-hydroxy-3-cyclohexene-1-carboxylate synthase